CSIDNDDSRDLDQLSVSESLPAGAVKIFVAVADVDAVVKKDMAIDQHARHNTTSVYTAAEIFPMLPEKLSTDLTSLNEGVDRLAMVVEMICTKDGELESEEIYRAAVRNQAKLAYDSVSVGLEGGAMPERARAAEDGKKLPPEPDAAALETFLMERRRADPVRFPDLSLVIVKLMGAGEYVVERPGQKAIGHFGLAVKDYTHSTAPNRRFPDLITQRLLKAAMTGAPLPYSMVDLAELAKHCTEREDDATKVERRVRKSAAALLLSGRIGAQFDGIITGASPKGTWVRIFQPPAEGRVERGFQGLDVGDRVRVKLVHT